MGPGRAGAVGVALSMLAACAQPQSAASGDDSVAKSSSTGRSNGGRGSSSASSSGGNAGSSSSGSSSSGSSPGAAGSSGSSVGGSSSSGGTGSTGGGSSSGGSSGASSSNGPQGSFCLLLQPPYQGPDAGCGPAAGGAGSAVIDIDNCTPIPGLLVSAVDQNQVPIAGMLATPDPTTGDFQVCEQSPQPQIFSLAFNAPGYPTSYGGERVVFPGKTTTETWVAMISNEAVASYAGLVPGGVDPTAGIVLSYIEPTTACSAAGWTASLAPWDAGAPDAGYGYSVYLDPTLVPDPSLTSTSLSGAVLFFNVDPSVASFAAVTLRQQPGAATWCVAAPPSTIYHTGRVIVGTGAVSFYPTRLAPVPTGSLCNSNDGPNHWADGASGCANGGFAGETNDFASCSGLGLATVSTLDENGALFATAPTVSPTAESSVACAPAGPTTLEIQTVGVAPSFFAEEPAPGAGEDDIAYFGAYPAQLLSAMEATLPAPPDPAKATVISYFPTGQQGSCDPSGWTATLLQADGGVAASAVYPGQTLALDASLTATSSLGVAVFVDVDPAQGPFFTTELTHAPDGGCHVYPPSSVRLTGRLFTAPGGVTYDPHFLAN